MYGHMGPQIFKNFKKNLTLIQKNAKNPKSVRSGAAREKYCEKRFRIVFGNRFCGLRRRNARKNFRIAPAFRLQNRSFIYTAPEWDGGRPPAGCGFCKLLKASARKNFRAARRTPYFPSSSFGTLSTYTDVDGNANESPLAANIRIIAKLTSPRMSV